MPTSAERLLPRPAPGPHRAAPHPSRIAMPSEEGTCLAPKALKLCANARPYKIATFPLQVHPKQRTNLTTPSFNLTSALPHFYFTSVKAALSGLKLTCCVLTAAPTAPLEPAQLTGDSLSSAVASWVLRPWGPLPPGLGRLLLPARRMCSHPLLHSCSPCRSSQPVYTVVLNPAEPPQRKPPLPPIIPTCTASRAQTESSHDPQMIFG